MWTTFSDDGKKALLFVYSDRSPGEYHLFDVASGQLLAGNLELQRVPARPRPGRDPAPHQHQPARSRQQVVQEHFEAAPVDDEHVGQVRLRRHDHAGLLQVADARLLLLPVRCLGASFVWATSPYVLVVQPSLPVKSVAELIAAGRVRVNGTIVAEPGAPVPTPASSSAVARRRGPLRGRDPGLVMRNAASEPKARHQRTQCRIRAAHGGDFARHATLHALAILDEVHAGLPRDLTIDDALALLRSPHVRRIAPLNVGSVPVSLTSIPSDRPSPSASGKVVGERPVQAPLEHASSAVQSCRSSHGVPSGSATPSMSRRIVRLASAE